MDAKIKVLVAGDVRGKFRALFQRVDTVNKKAGPFEILLCVGDFFSPDNNDELIAYKNGCKHIPVPTYILGPNTESVKEQYEDLNNGEICENLTYLGKRGIYTLSSGVKIVYLSGLEGEDNSKEYHFNKTDIDALRNSCLASKSSVSDYKGVDILLTSQWPYGMDEEQNKEASKLISLLSKEIRPRYHFCGLNGKHFEAQPHRVPADRITQLELCTRFISMAPVGNEKKEKFLHALNLSPVEKMRVLDIIQKTINEVKCPYLNLLSDDSDRDKYENNGDQYFYALPQDSYNMKRPGANTSGPNKRPRIMHIDQEKCWFCLSSADVESHLVIAIGQSFYLALAKGPINEFHVLIMSITHIPSAAQLTDKDWHELTCFKEALKELFKSEGMVVCFTERNYKSSHLQINALGIQEGFAWKIKHSFDDKAEEFNLPFETLPKLTSAQMLPKQGPYFIAELPDDTTLITRQMKHFPLHFARDVFCSENLLNCDEKVDWKDCKLDKSEEIEMVGKFREKFKPFNFTE